MGAKSPGVQEGHKRKILEMVSNAEKLKNIQGNCHRGKNSVIRKQGHGILHAIGKVLNQNPIFVINFMNSNNPCILSQAI